MVYPIRIGENLIMIPGEDFCSNLYVLEEGKECLLIDSGNGSTIPILDTLRMGLKVSSVLLTHGHADHISGMRYLPADGFVHKADFLDLTRINSFIPDFSPPDNIDPINFVKKTWGDFELEVIHTPGHTPGSVCFYDRGKGLLFSGDTLFSQGVGRTDLPGGDAEEMERSLHTLSSLDYTLLLPGHGPILKR